MLKRFFSSRRGKMLLIAAGVLAIPALALAWWLGSPLFLNKTVDESFDFNGRTLRPAEMSNSEVDAVMAEAAAVDKPMVEGMTGEMELARKLKTGEFRDADNFHRGSGLATIYRLPDGSHALRLEDLRVTNGPDLHVLLSPSADPITRDEVTVDGYINLGKLKGNIGNQNYDIPAGEDVSRFKSVVIYCKPFHVVFAVAPLSGTN